MIDFYTVVIRKSANYGVALCLENGLVGQGNTPEQSIDQLKQAIESFSEVYEAESDIYLSPLAINELHEFLTLENATTSETYEVRKVYA
jgi:predicted RNase H-like HicB family nuclease